MKTILITGISSGLGYATAEKFLERGYTVIGSTRKPDAAEHLKAKYPERLILWVCDLLNVNEIESIVPLLKQNHILRIDVLINNAGVATAGPFQLQDFSEIQQMITTNVLAVMKLSQMIIPFLIPSQGRIVNISSVSGKSGTPFLAGYCASKHAMEGFSESLRREMNLFGIKVIVIGPGSIKTPIWSKGFDRIREFYKSSVYAKAFDRFISFAQSEEKNGLSTDEVIQDILHAVQAQRPKMRYAPIPRKWRNWYWPMLLPKAIVDYMMCKALDLYIKKN